MNKKLKRIALESLIRIRDDHDGQLRQPKDGICRNLTMVCDRKISSLESMELIGELAQSWDKFSEDSMFPVPVPREDSGLDMSAEDYYSMQLEYCELWNLDHPYGRLRLELLNHCISTLEKELS